MSYASTFCIGAPGRDQQPSSCRCRRRRRSASARCSRERRLHRRRQVRGYPVRSASSPRSRVTYSLFTPFDVTPFRKLGAGDRLVEHARRGVDVVAAHEARNRAPYSTPARSLDAVRRGSGRRLNTADSACRRSHASRICLAFFVVDEDAPGARMHFGAFRTVRRSPCADARRARTTAEKSSVHDGAYSSGFASRASYARTIRCTSGWRNDGLRGEEREADAADARAAPRSRRAGPSGCAWAGRSASRRRSSRP